MVGKKNFEPKLIYKLTLDDLVPQDNIYRLLERFLDLRFLYKECEKMYGKTGKPSIDPIVFFKFQIYGYLENIISDRELVRRVNDSLSARYFLGYDIDESLPWHSTISRTRGLFGKDVFERIFNKVLELCNQSDLIGGKHQTIDSTLVKANASLDSVQRKVPELSVLEYIDRSFEENIEAEELKQSEKYNNEDKPKSGRGPKRNDVYGSKTDPDSRIESKPGKPTDLYYKAQYCADTKNRIITDVSVTFADKDDKYNLIESVDRAVERLREFDLEIGAVSADRGYSQGKNLRELEQRGITAYIPAPKNVNSKGEIDKNKFTFDKAKNIFICPNQQELRYFRYEKDRESLRYSAKKEACSSCPLKKKCCPQAKFRTIRQTIYYEEYERLYKRLKTVEAREAYILRKSISEGLFAEAKGYHGLKKFMTRGLDKAQKRAYIIATVQNIKRLAVFYRKKIKSTAKQIENYLLSFKHPSDFLYLFQY
jgi:transposase